jgi:hypothetical protein
MLASPLALVAGGSEDITEDDRDGSRGSWTVRRFIEHRVPVSVNFETSTENASYHLSVPNTATVTSASITLQGVERYSLKGTPNDFDDPVGHSHMAYYGQIGVFPPKASPSTYENIRIDPRDEDAFKFLDGTAYETSTPNGANPPNYPYQHFDLKIDKTGMVRLHVTWDGWGYCVGNDTNTHGAEMFLWNYSGLEWLRFGRYAANDTLGSPRGFSHTLMEPYDFTDGFGHVNILVFGQHDEPQGGGWTDMGSVATDHVTVTVLRNDTLQRPHGPSLAMGDADPFWSAGGDFTGTVTLAAGSGFQTALQSYVNSIAPWPAPLEVPFRFEVDRSTWGLIKVTDLAVTIREVDNQPPMFLSAKEVATEEDVDLVKAIDLQDHFDDDHNGPDLTYTVEYEQNASAVRAIIHTDGHHVNFLSVAKDWAGSLNFKFNATDVWGLTTISTNFTLMVEEVNDPPLLVDPGDLFIDEDLPFEFNISCIDPDLPYGDALSFEDDSPMFDIDPATGRIAFTPDQDDVGRHNVTVVVRDLDGRWNEVTFAIIVADVNDPPLISDPGVLVAYEDGKFDYNFTAVDEDGNDGFYWVLVGGVGTMKLGQYNGRLTWIPSGEFVGITNVSIIVTDKKGAADQVNVSIEVININDLPVLDELRPAQLKEGRPFSYTIGFSDPDLEEDPEEVHTFTLEPDLFPILPGGVIDFLPTNDHVGTYLLLVTITDAAGTTDEMEWELTVANVNERPTIEHVEDQSWREDQRVLMFINASDPDKGDVLTFTDSTSIFEINSRTGEINFTPAQMNVGAHTLRIVVTDSEGLYVDIYFEVTILPFNDAPTVSIRVVTIVDRLKEGDQLSLAADVEDEDDEMYDLSFFWFLDGKEVGIEASLVLDDLAPGDHTVELTVEDGDNRVSATYQFTVEDVEEPFSWLWIIVALVIVVVVAVLGLKVFRAVQDTETGPRGEGRDGQKEPEKPEVDHQDGAFDDWSGR